MDYEAIDREMSSWVISAVKHGTRFYLTDEGLGTDRLSRAMRYRWRDWAEDMAKHARAERAWQGFDWVPFSVAEAMGEEPHDKPIPR